MAGCQKSWDSLCRWRSVWLSDQQVRCTPLVPIGFGRCTTDPLLESISRCCEPYWKKITHMLIQCGTDISKCLCFTVWVMSKNFFVDWHLAPVIPSHTIFSNLLPWLVTRRLTSRCALWGFVKGTLLQSYDSASSRKRSMMGILAEQNI